MAQERPPAQPDEHAIGVALFRYGVIAELVERDDFMRGERSALVRQIAARSHYQPGRGVVPVSTRTVWVWLAAWRREGLDGLLPKVRKDRGTRRKLPDRVLARAIELRKEGPGRRTSDLLDIMELEQTIAPEHGFHRATLDRHLLRAGVTRRHLKTLAVRRTTKLHFDRFGALWVGDYKHGPLVLGPAGEPCTAKLGAFIDHATRYPVADRWYPGEDLASLRDTLLRALLVWGPPEKAYVDRGSVYRSGQLAWSLARIGSVLVHSRAYYSQGRGVIERWWQHADAFIEEVRLRPELPTIHQLNAWWQAWRQRRYLDQVHSELGMTPAEAIASVEPRPIDPDVARELFMARVTRTVGRSDACVSVEGRRFQCPTALQRRKVQVHFDPRDFSSVLIFADGQRVCQALPQQLNDPEPHVVPADDQPKPQSVDYLQMLRDDYDRQLLEHAKPLAYASLDLEPAFDEPAFVRVIADLAGLRPTDGERTLLAGFWQRWGPLVRIAAEHAVRLHGRARHPDIYTHAVRTLVLAHWRSPPQGKE